MVGSLAGLLLSLADWLGGLEAWLGRMDKQMNRWTQNFPILQDFVPYRSCCPKTKRPGTGSQGQETMPRKPGLGHWAWKKGAGS